MMNLLRQLFTYYWHLSLLRGTPAQTPYSKFLLMTSGIFLAFVMSVQWGFSDSDFSENIINTVLTSLFLILSYLGYTYIILYVKGLSSRWVQTATCLFICHIIVHICASPLLLVSPYLLHTNFKNPLYLFIGIIYLILTLGLLVWQFILTAYIYRFSLDVTAPQSVMTAFGLFAVNIIMVSFWR